MLLSCSAHGAAQECRYVLAKAYRSAITLALAAVALVSRRLIGFSGARSGLPMLVRGPGVAGRTLVLRA